MGYRRAVAALFALGLVVVTLWACSDSSGPRDQNYGSEAGAGYAGPEASALGDGGDAAD